MSAKFTFDGWQGDPLDMFDRELWSECLHPAMQAYNLVGDAAATQAAVSDTGLLHELVHLASGIPICTHSSIPSLRAELVRVLAAVDGALIRAAQAGGGRL